MSVESFVTWESLYCPATHKDEASLFALASVFPTPTPPVSRPSGRFFKSSWPILDLRSWLRSRAVGLSAMSPACVTSRSIPLGQGRGSTIFVVPEHRATGIGKQLMAGFEAWATGQGCVLVALATAGAASFYERLGYSSKARYFKKYLGTAPL